MCKLDNETIKYLMNGVYATTGLVCTTVAGKIIFNGMVKIFTNEVIVEEDGKKTTIRGMNTNTIAKSLIEKL